jgi:hypothetical protein
LIIKIKKIVEKELNRRSNGEEPQSILTNDIFHDLDLRILKVKVEAL